MIFNVFVRAMTHMKIAALALLPLICSVNCKKNESQETKNASIIVESWDCGAESWTVRCELDTNKTLRIFWKGAMKDYEVLPPWDPPSKPSDITATVIEDGVTTIGNRVFNCCGNLMSVTIPNSLTSIGIAAFSHTDLTHITIPNSVISIGVGAFDICLASVTIPGSVMFIGNLAFNRVATITVADNNPNYSSIDGVLFNKDKTKLIQYPATKKDTMYTIPNTVTTIGSYAFYGSTYLKSVTIPNSVTSIENRVFAWCDSLKSITIPSSITSINNEAFEDSWGIISFICLNPVPPQVNSYVFRNINIFANLYVPSGSRAAYRAADGWNKFGCVKIVKVH
jgi:hypothetical protein